MKKIKNSHVMIIGVGGVGSWAAESLARSSVGRITLLDFDTICIRNFNRQIQAMDGEIGKPKAMYLLQGSKIHPEGEILKGLINISVRKLLKS